MRATRHATILVQAIVVWVLFWVAGLPRYYRQYSDAGLGVACTVLSVAISLVVLFFLLRCNPKSRREYAWWLSVYYTIPFAALDTLYVGIYLGRGWYYLVEYWYLTVFYVTPWFTFLPTVALLDRYDSRKAAAAT